MATGSGRPFVFAARHDHGCRGRHDRIDAARYTGWYADCYQYEILTGYVYAFEPDTDDLDDDDEAPTTYYAIEIALSLAIASG